MNILYDDLLDIIYSFLIPKIENNELILTNDIYFLNLSSKYLNTTIQKYLKKYYNCYKIKYFNFIHWASKNGHINVLEWLKNNNYEFKYCINYIIKLKNINILSWFKNNTNNFKNVDFFTVSYKRHTNFSIETIKYE
jgi:ankyrin repeat protein